MKACLKSLPDHQTATLVLSCLRRLLCRIWTRLKDIVLPLISTWLYMSKNYMFSQKWGYFNNTCVFELNDFIVIYNVVKIPKIF